MKLSVLYIVCNEEQILPKSIDSIRHIADEVIVVDAGSQDKTKEVARDRRCSVLHHAWVHDFSKIRNFGVGACNGDWILCLDADEMLDPKSAALVRQSVETARQNVMAFGLNIVDYESDMGWSTPPNEKPFFKSPQVRLFRRHNSIRFFGKVEESVNESVEKIGGSVDLLQATIHHWLWKGKGKDYKELKLSYYKSLGASFDQRTEDRLAARGAEMPLPTKTMIGQNPQVAIVVCAFNALGHTKECLSSLRAHTTIPHSIYFVDNGSTDGTYSYASSSLGRNPIRFPRNQGIPKARNAGARAAMSDPRTRYVCFVDNDVKVTPGWLEKMVKTMEDHPEVGLLAPLSQSGSGAQNGAQFGFKGDRDLSEVASENKGGPAYADFVERFCMMLRTETLDKVGLFDEGFGFYGSESQDLCMRIRAAGLRVAVANNVFMWHKGGATLEANPVDWSSIKAGSSQRLRHKYNLKVTDEIISPNATFNANPALGRLGVPNSFSRQPDGAAHPPTSIVVLGCNRVDVTAKCIDSIFANTSNFELIFVDNGSTDGTQGYISGFGDRIRYIRNDKNLGIPIARNQGIVAARHPYLLLIDNDCVVKQNWLADFFKEMPSSGGIVGLEGWKMGSDWLPSSKCFGSSEKADYLGGACCLFSRSVFEKAGLLDEGFSPAYFEDPDISYRARQAGFPLIWHPTHLVIHEEHATLIHGGQKDFHYQDAMSNSYTRFNAKMTGKIQVEHRMLQDSTKKLKILYLGMRYDYGVQDRGNSFEHDNFYASMRAWEHAGALTYFDFAELARNHGVPKMSDMLLEAVNSQQPDAIFSIFFNPEHDPKRDVVAKITSTTKAKTIGWFCDSHFRYENFDRPWADSLSFCVTTSTMAEAKYKRDGLGAKVIKSQWACAPTYKRIDGIKKDVPVSFVGQPHGNRRTVIQTMRTNGIPVQAFGTGWERRLSLDEMVLMFNRSLVNLNLNNSADQTVKQIKGRNFEVPGCGGLLLTEVAENLSDYYTIGKEIDTYASLPELVSKTKYYMNNPDQAMAMGKAAYDRTMSEHTYAHRFNHIFGKAGLI